MFYTFNKKKSNALLSKTRRLFSKRKAIIGQGRWRIRRKKNNQANIAPATSGFGHSPAD